MDSKSNMRRAKVSVLQYMESIANVSCAALGQWSDMDSKSKRRFVSSKNHAGKIHMKGSISKSNLECMVISIFIDVEAIK